MNSHKFSISLPNTQCSFIEQYKKEHHYSNTSKVFQDAIYLLQQAHLESCYKEANEELDDSFDITLADGIDNEAW